MTADPEPALAREARRLLEAEAAAGFDDSSTRNGLSGWIADKGESLGALARLAQYSRLRPRTRQSLAQAVLQDLGTSRRPVAVARDADAPVTELPGIGVTAQKRLATLGIQTIGDLLHHRPRRYIDHSSVVPIAEAEPGRDVTVIGDVVEIRARPARSGRVRVVEAAIADKTGQILAVWFNQVYLAKTLRGRRNVAFAGRVESGAYDRQLTSPEYELDMHRMVHAGRLVPVYPLTRGLSQRQLRRWMALAVDDYAPSVPEALSEQQRRDHGLPDVATAIRHLHFPVDATAAQAAARRFAFAELLTYQLAILRRRQAWRESQPGRPVRIHRDALEAFGGQLPFKLTDGQRVAVAEVLNDLRRDRPMSRLLQGDVGSGKTVVAAGALHAIVDDGWQGAIMAPTEVLAEQHAATLRELLTPLGVRVELVTGSIPAGEKRRLWRDVERGGVHVVVGTQAIIQRSARFARLNLAVVDEQHRFGVQQRGEIRAKGYNPHLLAMSATPIPRTLALTVYGDLDVSVLRELPTGRRPVKTSFVPTHRRGDAYAFIRRAVADGHQAFIVFPIIEESESLNARAATEEHKRLTRGAFADLAEHVGLLHGRMSAASKERVMRSFRDGEIKILVSTSVIEVGIDVPNATVMLIEGAERFGLAQLHQLRGRVGRGDHPSFCLLMSETTDPRENARLRTLQTVSDGFTLAERDLELRGPGDVIGTRQSGALGFRFASVSDLPTIQAARMDAETLVRADPQLIKPQHAVMAAAVGQLLKRNEWN
ncbi:MAG: ATP-dependent DNA helicase RecG [Chloroflexi bacterium]|nr:ATP-dependent DNA helicase RecG [Chloroflexota bacterium]